MIRRIIGLIALLWMIGFVVFILSVGKPLDGHVTDGIVVLTGGPGRIERGVEMLRQGKAHRLLISGVARAVTPHQLAVENRIEARLISCCIDLGHAAVDTKSNAQETERWVAAHNYRTIRLVTVDWHMARAQLELSHQLGKNVEVSGDAVSQGNNIRLLTLFIEYNKYLFRGLAMLVGAG